MMGAVRDAASNHSWERVQSLVGSRWRGVPGHTRRYSVTRPPVAENLAVLIVPAARPLPRVAAASHVES